MAERGDAPVLDAEVASKRVGGSRHGAAANYTIKVMHAHSQVSSSTHAHCIQFRLDCEFLGPLGDMAPATV